MFFYELLILLGVVVVIVVLYTQILAPAVAGEPLFPMFRKSVVQQEIKKAEKDLVDVAEAAHLKELAAEVERRKAQLEQKENNGQSE